MGAIEIRMETIRNNTKIGLPADKESKNLFGELVYKIGMSLNVMTETFAKLIKSANSF